MLKKVNGLIVDEIDYKENSKIIKVLTDEELVSIMCHGVKDIKKGLYMAIGKLNYCSFNIDYKKDGLSILRDVSLIDHYRKIKTDLVSIAYSAFLVNLVMQIVAKDKNKKNICYCYYLITNALAKINENFDPEIITLICEVKLLEVLGIRPYFDGCVVCNNKEIVTISSNLGGYVCKSCRTKEYVYNERVLKLIKLFFYVDISKIESLDIKKDIIKDISKFIGIYYHDHTGIYYDKDKMIYNLINV